MNTQTIDDVFAANDRVRAKLRMTLEDISPEEAAAKPPDEKWTIAGIVEHLSMVEDGMVRICAKLLKKAETEGRSADGRVTISTAFHEKSEEVMHKRLEAPQIVHPTGKKTLADSMAKMDENRARLHELRTMFESFDGTEYTFPHPYFGDLTAHEWLAMIGGHEARHLKQIRTLLEKVR
jgi:hypothetical protein